MDRVKTSTHIVVKIRLQRYGTKKRPFYRVVAADVRNRRDGRFIEQLGTYDAVKYDTQIHLNEERTRYWLEKGAIPTPTVSDILKRKGLLAEQS